MGRGVPSLGAGAEPDGQALQGLGRTIRGSRPKACTQMFSRRPMQSLQFL